MISSLHLSVLSEICFPIVWSLLFTVSFKTALTLKSLLGFCQSRFVDIFSHIKKINLKNCTNKLCNSLFPANMQKCIYDNYTRTVVPELKQYIPHNGA